MIGLVILAALMSTTGAHVHHDWVRLPGYPNVLVDMASVKLGPGWLEVKIRLNGHGEEMLTSCGPKENYEAGDDQFTRADKHGEQKLVGTIPNGAVEALICPKNSN